MNPTRQDGSDGLTTSELWDDSWRGRALPEIVDTADRSQPLFRAILAPIDAALSLPPGGRMLELGGAPGAIAGYFVRRYGLEPTIVDFSPEGIELTRRNFQLLGIEGHVHQADFRSWEPAEPFDLVCSFGLIEHFTDVDVVLGHHFRMTKPGGFVVIGVPNFRGVAGTILRWLSPGLFDWHNTEAMRLDLLQSYAAQFNAETVFAGHVGGFDPGVLTQTERKGVVPKIVTTAFRGAAWALRRPVPLWRSINAGWWSTYLVCVFRVPVAGRQKSI